MAAKVLVAAKEGGEETPDADGDADVVAVVVQAAEVEA